jgi:two-component system, NarL family, nitrate/nitrite response regulator NarL
MALQPAAVSHPGRLRPARSKRISILIADETQMGCELLKHALTRSSPHFKVVDCAASRAEIFQALRSHPLDVALVSESLEEGPLAGFEVLSELRAAYPQTRVIFLLKSASEPNLVAAFRAGAKGVFCKSEPIPALRKSIQAVYGGQIWANSRQLHLILEALVNTTPPRAQEFPKGCLLAKREEEVARLVAEGMTNREVAERLGLSEHTVSNYLFRIYEKLGLSGRVELVLYVLNQRQEEDAERPAISAQG